MNAVKKRIFHFSITKINYESFHFMLSTYFPQNHDVGFSLVEHFSFLFQLFFLLHKISSPFWFCFSYFCGRGRFFISFWYVTDLLEPAKPQR